MGCSDFFKLAFISFACFFAFIDHSISAPDANPSGFSGVALDESTIRWSWMDNSSDEDGFEIRNSSGNFIHSVPANPGTGSIIYSDESGLFENTMYTRNITGYTSTQDTETIDQHQNSISSSSHDCTYGNRQYAQTFTPSITGILTNIQVHGCKYHLEAIPARIMVYPTSGGLPDKSNGSLAEATFSFLNSVAEWTTVFFSPPEYLESGRLYACVIDSPSAAEPNHLLSSGTDYTSGQWMSSYDGTNWNTFPVDDLAFKTCMRPETRDYGITSTDFSTYTAVHEPLADNYTLRDSGTGEVIIDITPPPNGNLSSTGVWIQRIEDGQFWTSAVDVTLDWTDTYQITDFSIAANGAYRYRLKFRNGDGIQTGWSPDNAVTLVSYPPLPPDGFHGVTVSENSIRWIWNDNSSDETGFVVQDTSDNNQIFADANATSVLKNGLMENEYYTRRCRAFAGAVQEPAAAYDGSYTSSPAGSDYYRGFRFVPIFDMQITHVAVYAGSRVCLFEDHGSSPIQSHSMGATPQGWWVWEPLTVPWDLTGGTTYQIVTHADGEEFTYYWDDIEDVIESTHINILTGCYGPSYPSTILLSDVYGLLNFKYSLGQQSYSTPSLDYTLCTPVHEPLAGDLALRDTGSGVVEITVNAPNNGDLDLTGVFIERDDDGLDWGNAVLVSNWTNLYELNDSVSSNGTWYYRIKYSNAEGLETAYLCEPLDVTSYPPEDPTGMNFIPGSVTESSVTWRWTDNSTDEDGFELQDESGGFVKTIPSVDGTGSIEHTESGLEENTFYTRRVYSYNLIEGDSYSDIPLSSISTGSSPDAGFHANGEPISNMDSESENPTPLYWSCDRQDFPGRAVDQSNTIYNTYHSIDSNSICAQRFTPGMSGNLDRIILSLFRSSSSTNPITVEIREDDGSGTHPSSTVLASDSGTFSPGYFTPVSFYMSTAAPVSASAYYWIVARSNDTPDEGYRWHCQNTNVYDGSQSAAIYSGDSWDNYNHDFYFRIYLLIDPQEIWTDFSFDISGTGLMGTDIESLTFTSRTFFTGSDSKTPLDSGAPGDSMEFDYIDEAEVRIYNCMTENWESIGTGIFSTIRPEVFRDSVEGELWDHVDDTNPCNPIIRTKNSNWSPDYINSGEILIRLFMNGFFSPGMSHDASWIFDYVKIDIESRIVSRSINPTADISVCTKVHDPLQSDFSVYPGSFGKAVIDVTSPKNATLLQTGVQVWRADNAGMTGAVIAKDFSNIYTYEDTIPEGGIWHYAIVFRNAEGVETAMSGSNWADIPGPSAPAADFSADKVNAGIGENINFSDTSSGSISTWSWDFGDGSGTSDQKNPSYSYISDGVYTVSLTVTGGLGSDTEIKTDYITITIDPPPATPDFHADPLYGEASLLVNFYDSSTGSINSWSWNFGDGTTSNEQNPTHSYDSSGLYTVSLTVDGTYGGGTEIKTDFITVIEPQLPTADFTASPLIGEAPLLVSFTNASTGTIDSYSWDFGDGGTSTSMNPSYQYDAPGIYTIILTVTRVDVGSDTRTRTNYVTVSSTTTTVADFTASPLSGNAPLLVSFSDESTGVHDSLFWDFDSDGNFDSSSTNPTHLYKQAGTYTVSLVIDGPDGSDSETKIDYIIVEGTGLTSPDFSAIPTSGVVPLTVNFTDESVGEITNREWDFGDGGMSTEKNPSHTYDTTGVYTVSLTVNGTRTETKISYIVVDSTDPPLSTDSDDSGGCSCGIGRKHLHPKDLTGYFMPVLILTLYLLLVRKRR